MWTLANCLDPRCLKLSWKREPNFVTLQHSLDSTVFFRIFLKDWKTSSASPAITFNGRSMLRWSGPARRNIQQAANRPGFGAKKSRSCAEVFLALIWLRFQSGIPMDTPLRRRSKRSELTQPSRPEVLGVRWSTQHLGNWWQLDPRYSLRSLSLIWFNSIEFLSKI